MYQSIFFNSLIILSFIGNGLFALIGLKPYNFIVNVQILSALVFTLCFISSYNNYFRKFPTILIIFFAIILCHLFIFVLAVQQYSIDHIEHTLALIINTLGVFGIAKYSLVNKNTMGQIRYIIACLNIFILCLVLMRFSSVHELINRNYLIFSSLSITIFSVWIDDEKWYFANILNFTICLCLCLILQSITGLLCIVVVALFLIGYSLRKSKIITRVFVKTLVTVSMLTVVLYVLATDYYSVKINIYLQSFADPNFDSRESGAQRVLMMYYGLNLISEFYNAGVGLLNSRYYWSSPWFPGDVSTHLHNTFLEIFVSYGVYFGVIWVVFMFGRQFFLRLFFQRRKDVVFLGVIISVIFAVNNTVFLQLPVWFWIIGSRVLWGRN